MHEAGALHQWFYSSLEEKLYTCMHTAEPGNIQLSKIGCEMWHKHIACSSMEYAAIYIVTLM